MSSGKNPFSVVLNKAPFGVSVTSFNIDVSTVGSYIVEGGGTGLKGEFPTPNMELWEKLPINLDTLKANRVISQSAKKVKIFGICEISQPMTVTGILVSKGAKESIEKAGGTVASIETKPIKEKFVKTSKKKHKKTSENKEESPE